MSFNSKRFRSDSGDDNSDSRSNLMESFHKSKHGGGKTVFVANISFECTEEDIYDEFSQVGEVENIEMLKNDSGRFKGCALVTYKTSSEAKEAMDTLHKRELKGRILIVKEEDAMDEKRGGRKKPRFEQHQRTIPRSIADEQVDQNTYGLSMSFLSSLKIELPLIPTVFVANLSYDVHRKGLKELASLAGRVLDCDIFMDKEGKSRGFGLVEYEHPVEAVQCISMLNNQIFFDRPLSIRMDRSDQIKERRLPPGLKGIGRGLGPDGNALRNIKALDQSNQLSLNQIQPQLAQQIGSALMGNQNPMGGIGGNMLNNLSAAVSSLSQPSMNNMNNMNNGSGLFGAAPPSSGGGGGSGLGNIIQIMNLPPHYTNDQLQKLVWNCADVVMAEIRSNGNGIVRLRTEQDARRTMQMLDQQQLDGRILRVNVL